MPVHVNRVLVIRHDREDSDPIAILNFKRLQFFRYLRSVLGFGNIHAQHRLSFVGYQTLYFDVPQRGGREKSAGKFQHARQSLLVAQFVERRAANHPFDSHLRPNRRDLNGVAILQPLQVRLHSVEEKVIHIHGLHQLRAAVMLQDSHRTALCRPARREQRVQWCGKRTDVVGAGIGDIAHFIDPDRPQAS